MWNWRRPLRMLLRELNVESALFESSCERFLEGAGDTGGMGGVTILMTGENGNGEWSEFHTKLALHMGKDIADTFIYEATQMHGYLKKLETKLHLDDFTIQDLLKSNKHKGKNIERARLRIIWTVLKSDDLLADIRATNMRMERLAPRRSRRARPIPSMIPKMGALEAIIEEEGA
ncbi:hypothetical protein FPQ18DRAFT_309862 [Pyronema domesticum]|nr:hypothetical protein FPQ18DRAFT_309862 [Pyronema domesticum]